MTKGERIKKLRTQANLSQVVLANKIGVSKQTLYKYENDIVTNVPSDKIEKLAEALGTTPPYIMGWEDGFPINPMSKMKDVEKIARLANKSIPEVLGFDATPEDYAGKDMRVFEIRKKYEARNGIVRQSRNAFIDNQTARLLFYFSILNTFGQEELLKRIQEMTELEKYTKK